MMDHDKKFSFTESGASPWFPSSTFTLVPKLYLHPGSQALPSPWFPRSSLGTTG